MKTKLSIHPPIVLGLVLILLLNSVVPVAAAPEAVNPQPNPAGRPLAVGPFIVSPNTYYANSTSVFTYTGSYVFDNNTPSGNKWFGWIRPISNSWANSYMTTKFNGQWIKVHYIRAGDAGGLHVWIDGVDVVGLNEYQGSCGDAHNSDCYSDWTSSTYTSGIHTVKLSGPAGWYTNVNFMYIQVGGTAHTTGPSLGVTGPLNTWINYNPTFTPACSDSVGVAEQYVSTYNGGWTSAITPTATSDVWVNCMDNAGYWSVGKVGTTYIDKTAPNAGGSVMITPTSPTKNPVSVTVPIGADTGGSGSRGINCTLNNSNVPTTDTTAQSCMVSVPSNGTVYYRTKDNAGNWSGLGSVNVTNIDTVSPNPGTVTTNAGISIWSQPGALVSVNPGTDTGLGTRYAWCKLEGGSFIHGSNATTPCTQTVNTPTSFYYYTEDLAGNVSATQSQAVTLIDGTAPLLTYTQTAGGNTWVSPGGVVWSDTSLTVEAAGNDPGGSGISATHCKLASEPGWASGTSTCQRTSYASDTFQYYGVDVAGNYNATSSSPLSLDLHIDHSLPVLGFAGALDGHGYLEPQTLTPNSSDTDTGIASQGVALSLQGPFTTSLLVDQSAEIFCQAADQVGNTRTASCGHVYVGDEPALSFAGANPNSFYGEGEVLTLTPNCTDMSGTGLASQGISLNAEGPFISSLTVNGTSTIYCQATDNTGLTNQGACGTIHYDLAAPTLSASAEITSPTNQPVKLTVLAQDPESGVAVTYCKLAEEASYTQSADGAPCERWAVANTTLYFYAKDQVGNESNTGSLAVANIDTTPPSLPTGSLAGSLLTVSATDSGSGITAYTVRRLVDPSRGLWQEVSRTDPASPEIALVAGALDGRDRVQVQALDAAGNVSPWYDSGIVIVAPVTQYYHLGDQLVAERRGEELVYLTANQLTSTTLVTDSQGELVSSVRYSPYGEDRYYQDGVLTTDKTYTGQREEAGLGLMDYNARFYDPSIMRFIQPDPIVPGIGEGGNPNAIGYLGTSTFSPLTVNYHENQFLEQLNLENRTRLQDPKFRHPPVPTNSIAFDRYAYSFNNPIRYTDPTGHCPFCVGVAVTLGAMTPVGWAAIGVTAIGIGLYIAVPGVREAVTTGIYEAGEAAVNGVDALLAKTNKKPQGSPLQTGGNKLTERTRKALGLTKDQAKQAVEGLKEWAGKENDFHGQIWPDGTITDPNTDEEIGNIKDFLP